MYITYDSAEPPTRTQSEEPVGQEEGAVPQRVNDVTGQRQTRRVRVKIGIHSGNVIRCAKSRRSYAGESMSISSRVVPLSFQ